jgi:hypothetical protein
MIEWLSSQQSVLWTLGIVSAITFVGSLLSVPVLIARMPADYFASPTRHRSRWSKRHPLLRVTITLCRNLLGGLLVLAGIAMLVLPGQGILTIAVGIVLMDFPGKHRLERWVVCRPRVLRSMNWIRARSQRPPLVIDPSYNDETHPSTTQSGAHHGERDDAGDSR